LSNFAQPTQQILQNAAPLVSMQPTGGQAFALTADGKIPSSLLPETDTVGYRTGWVSSDASSWNGTQFAPTHSGTGIYAVTFSPSLNNTPVVNVTPIDTGAGSYHSPVLTVAPTETGFTVEFRNNVGTPTNVDWNFLAREIT
jgi:hypothetical protein